MRSKSCEKPSAPQRLAVKSRKIPALRADGFDDVAPFDELEREARKTGIGRDGRTHRLDEIGMMEARERRELASERLFVLRGAGLRQFFESGRPVPGR
jgi:hypothetical protein